MSEQLDQESFAARVEEATQEADFEVERREGLNLYVVLHGEPTRCNVEKLYSAYQLSPDRLDDIVGVHLEALRSVPPASQLPSEEEAAESLLPMLNPSWWLEEVGQQGGEPPVHRPFLADLIVTYVFDFPQHRAYVNQDMLAQMMDSPETTFEMIHEYALDNLRKRTTSEVYDTYGMFEKTMVVCETHDGYAATRVLLPDLMATWAERIPGRMLIGVPNRDFLIAFSDRDPEHARSIADQVRHDARQRDHPLSPELLVWRDGRVREYQPRH